MFNNPGEKIKSYAYALFALYVVIGLFVAFVVAFELEEQEGLLAFFGILIGTAITAYISCLFLVAFGELVENSTTIVRRMSQKSNNDVNQPDVATEVKVNQPDVATEVKVDQPITSQMDTKERLYQMAIVHMKTGNRVNIESAIKDFELIRGYKDANELLEKCKKMI